jgi:ribonuclease J
VRIHRGAAEVGGTVIELEAEGDRLVLEAGLPLSANTVEYRDLQPDVPGLWSRGDGSLKGLIISHGHPDHYGLADLVTPEVPIYMGRSAKSVIDAAAFFTGRDPGFNLSGHLRDKRAIRIGRFTVTPYLVDHSGFDAYAVMVDAGGKRLFYSGDLRGHGRKGGCFTRLLERPPAAIDCLLLEGTNFGREADAAADIVTETDLEQHLRDRFIRTRGTALAFYSAQNIDRLVTVYRAASASGRQLVFDLYGATVAAATGNGLIPQAGWSGVRVFVPRSQRIRVKESGQFWRVNALGDSRIYLEELAEDPASWVITTRSSYLGELEQSGCLAEAKAFWMMWRGYLKGNCTFDSVGVEVEPAHVSGHASELDLSRLFHALAPNSVVPIHTGSPEGYSTISTRVRMECDGKWWIV